MSGDPAAGSASGLAGRRGQRQLLDQVQYPAGQPGRQTGCPGDELAGRGQDYFRPAAADSLDDLPGGPLGVHRQQRHAGAEREPGELLPGLPGETGVQTGAAAHKPGYGGGNRHRAAEFGAQPFGESDGSELGGAVGQQVRDAELTADRRDRDDPAMALTLHDRQRRERQADGGERHGLHRVLVVAELRRLHRANLDDPGVVHHDVEAAVTLDRGIDQALRQGLVGQVAGARRTSAPAARNWPAARSGPPLHRVTQPVLGDGTEPRRLPAPAAPDTTPHSASSPAGSSASCTAASKPAPSTTRPPPGLTVKTSSPLDIQAPGMSVLSATSNNPVGTPPL